MTDLFKLRRDFSLKSLVELEVLADPILMFEYWFNEAVTSEIIEPNAMCLSTVSAEGKPSSRVLLLKQIKPDGFVFFTNYESKKAQHISQNKYCALNFMWHELERQVRIEGVVEKISETESDAYFESRPIKSKLGAWASPQSKVIPDREYLDALVADFEQEFRSREITRPANWGGYILRPTLVEFWQGRPSRLHDRIQYRLEENVWIVERLAP